VKRANETEKLVQELSKRLESLESFQKPQGNVNRIMNGSVILVFISGRKES
jgi:hypothetical protein